MFKSVLLSRCHAHVHRSLLGCIITNGEMWCLLIIFYMYWIWYGCRNIFPVWKDTSYIGPWIFFSWNDEYNNNVQWIWIEQLFYGLLIWSLHKKITGYFTEGKNCKWNFWNSFIKNFYPFKPLLKKKKVYFTNNVIIFFYIYSI